MSSAEYSCKLFKPIFAYRQEQSDMGPHYLQKLLFFKSQADEKADNNSFHPSILKLSLPSLNLDTSIVANKGIGQKSKNRIV